ESFPGKPQGVEERHDQDQGARRSGSPTRISSARTFHSTVINHTSASVASRVKTIWRPSRDIPNCHETAYGATDRTSCIRCVTLSMRYALPWWWKTSRRLSGSQMGQLPIVAICSYLFESKE